MVRLEVMMKGAVEQLRHPEKVGQDRRKDPGFYYIFSGLRWSLLSLAMTEDKKYSHYFSFLAGIICGLCFAPVFFLPGVFLTSALLAQIKSSKTKFEAAKFGYMFGFGFYLATLYWISFGVSVYIEQFWWAIPFALLGLPAFLAIFTAILSMVAWQFRDRALFHFIFCSLWVLIEWTMSWIFTGLPWGVLGYALSNWLVMIQFADIFGIFGLSFFVIYIGSGFYEKVGLYSRLLTSHVMIILVIIYGTAKIQNNPTEYTEILARIVQPSIPQTEKWNPKEFWQNLDLQIELSKQKGNGEPDVIVWSEAALTVPYNIKPVFEALLSVFANGEQILITGGVADNNKIGDELKIYSSMIGLKKHGKIFEYHKAHLVPFGEYMPFKDLLPFKKITHGLIDYTQGVRENIDIEQLSLVIQPLVCYESIFSVEVKTSNSIVDAIINITNDAWYGNSSGPYQHFEISRMRSVENGLPMLRASNNGISGFIDPLGRVLNKTTLDDITIIDNFIPKKLPYETWFSRYSMWTLFLGGFLVLILQLLCKYFLKLYYN